MSTTTITTTTTPPPTTTTTTTKPATTTTTTTQHDRYHYQAVALSCPWPIIMMILRGAYDSDADDNDRDDGVEGDYNGMVIVPVVECDC